MKLLSLAMYDQVMTKVKVFVYGRRQQQQQRQRQQQSRGYDNSDFRYGEQKLGSGAHLYRKIVSSTENIGLVQVSNNIKM